MRLKYLGTEPRHYGKGVSVVPGWEGDVKNEDFAKALVRGGDFERFEDGSKKPERTAPTPTPKEKE